MLDLRKVPQSWTFEPMPRIRREAINTVLITAGVLSAAMGLKGFLLSSNFVDGGVTGVSMLLAKVTSLPLALWLPLVNIPFILIAYRRVSFPFALRSVLAIAGLVAALTFIPFPDVTPDPLLTAIFGGIFIGAGIGLAIRGGAVLDGTEIAALLISKRSSFLRVGDVILGFNVVLFLAAMTVLGVHAALYSILTYFAAAKTLDFVLYGLDEFTAVTIISDKSAEIRKHIVEELGRGVTIFKGQGGATGSDKEILYCVVTRLEIAKTKSIVREIDEGAFFVFHTLAGVEGSMVKAGQLH